jgi:hypothetical protein
MDSARDRVEQSLINIDPAPAARVEYSASPDRYTPHCSRVQEELFANAGFPARLGPGLILPGRWWGGALFPHIYLRIK